MQEIKRIEIENYDSCVNFNANSKKNRLGGKTFSVIDILAMNPDEIAWMLLHNEIISNDDKKQICSFMKNEILSNTTNAQRYATTYNYMQFGKRFELLLLHTRIVYERLLNCLNQLKYMEMIDEIMGKYEDYLKYRVNAPAEAIIFLQRVATFSGMEVFKKEELLSIELNAELMDVVEREKNNILIRFDEKKGGFLYNRNINKFNRKNIITAITEDYKNIKSFIEVCEEWITEFDLIDFVPYDLVLCIDFIKHPEKRNYIPIEYFKSHYNKILKEKPTEAKRIKKQAVFPDYAEIKPNIKKKCDYYFKYMESSPI